MCFSLWVPKDSGILATNILARKKLTAALHSRIKLEGVNRKGFF
jgi:hypothetical protein